MKETIFFKEKNHSPNLHLNEKLFIPMKFGGIFIEMKLELFETHQ